jgi:hypothetical protein
MPVGARQVGPEFLQELGALGRLIQRHPGVFCTLEQLRYASRLNSAAAEATWPGRECEVRAIGVMTNGLEELTGDPKPTSGLA